MCHQKESIFRGTCVAQSGKHLTLAQVMISQFMSSSPTLGCVPTAQSLELALDSMSPSLSLPLPCLCSVSLCLSKNQTLKKIKKENRKKNNCR